MRASASLARSPLFATPSAVSPREAFILLTLVAHPGLLAGQAEMLAGLDFAHADTRRIRQALVDFDAHREADGESDAHAGIVASGLGDVLARLEAVVRHGDRWCLELRGRSRRSEGKPKTGHDLASARADAT